MIIQNYDITLGWDLTKPGWHEVTLYFPNTAESAQKFITIYDWAEKNIDNYHKHARWMLGIRTHHYKFRYTRDYTWFNLTWK